jgi:hypothetical protein
MGIHSDEIQTDEIQNCFRDREAVPEGEFALPILPAAIVYVVDIDKRDRFFSKSKRVCHALLRHFNDVLGYDFSHGAGIAGTGEPIAGFLQPVPGIFESGRE